MRILHIGQAILPTTSSKPLHICNVLHVPSVKKNLLSVPRLTHDNNVLVEFHPDSFFVPLMLHSPSKFSALLKPLLLSGMHD
jgi:histone deacetylase 1/2